MVKSLVPYLKSLNPLKGFTHGVVPISEGGFPFRPTRKTLRQSPLTKDTVVRILTVSDLSDRVYQRGPTKGRPKGPGAPLPHRPKTGI